MSIAVMSRVWATSTFKSGDLLVLLSMADHADDAGICWPSVALLARKARMTERNVQRCLRALTAAGEIVVVRLGGMKDGKKLSTIYRILPPPTGDNLPPVKSPTGDVGVAVGVTPTSPKPSVEPSISLVIAAAIYDTYPRKVGKPAAIRAIKAALKTMTAPELSARVAAFAAVWSGQDLTFCPHPATWFNQERYNDDPSTWKRHDTDKRPTAGGSNRTNGTANAAVTAAGPSDRAPVRGVQVFGRRPSGDGDGSDGVRAGDD